ncbi:MAG: hypothetical protein M1827_003745 [Pycnora praestabilis]|nr:MAG: hypothetical protein M1827_003745 [Pycnora praestabilis]
MSAERKGYHGPSIFEGKSQVDSTARPAWFTENIESIPESGRRLLENYSEILPEQVLPHRDKAFNIWSYACIGQVRFLDFTLPKLPYWSQVLPRLRSGATFMDAGCCFGQEIRFLVFVEGIPATQLYGFDLEPAFIDMGYELFRDRDKLHANMLSGNVQADPTAPDQRYLTDLVGTMDIVHAASLLHSWGWDDMIIATKRLVSLTRKQPGSIVIGNQMGSLDAGQYPMPTGKGFNYRHNVDSMERFWRQVGEETGSSWKVESGMFLPAVVKENMEHSWAKSDPNLRMIWFCATRA